MPGNSANALVWPEGTASEEIYPDGIRGAVATFLEERGNVATRTRAIDDEAQCVRSEGLEWADVVV